MLGTFSTISKNFRIRPKDVSIDNAAFRLHYRATTLILLAASALVTSRQYVGEHIACVSHEKGIPEHVMNTFCFFTATFTVVKHTNASLVRAQHVPHLGVGPLHPEDEIIRHNYYQWVPFVLFGQALAFYLPHYIWKRKEGGRLAALTSSLGHVACQKSTVDKREKLMGAAKQYFLEGLHIHSGWALWLLACEILNAVNLVLQFCFTNMFLAGGFLSFGPAVVNAEDPTEVLDSVFPKVTKCTFYKYGASGTLQVHDAICILALNIVNEKIFLFLWFWYVILAIITLLALAWRVLALCLHSRSPQFNALVLGGGITAWKRRRGLRWTVLDVTYHLHISDWIFLRYLGRNMDPAIYERLLISVAENLESGETTPLKQPFPDSEDTYLNRKDE